jgi:mRNA-degrading endonuclease RelE of RelBE toxin-antitoxin system
MPEYRILYKNHSVEQSWHYFQDQMPEKMGEIKKFLKENPNDRSKAPGKLKKLKGKLKRFLQYDITDSDRIWYEVDSNKKAVYVEYIGPHP